MATLPEEEEQPQPVRERVIHAVTAPVERNRTLVVLAIAAGAGATAPLPFGVIVAMASVVAAFELAKKR